MVNNKQKRNNKKTKAPPSAAAAARAMTMALTLKCRHSSTAKKFAKGSDSFHATNKYIYFRRKRSVLYFRDGIPDYAEFGRDPPAFNERSRVL